MYRLLYSLLIRKCFLNVRVDGNSYYIFISELTTHLIIKKKQVIWNNFNRRSGFFNNYDGWSSFWYIWFVNVFTLVKMAAISLFFLCSRGCGRLYTFISMFYCTQIIPPHLLCYLKKIFKRKEVMLAFCWFVTYRYTLLKSRVFAGIFWMSWVWCRCRRGNSLFITLSVDRYRGT